MGCNAYESHCMSDVMGQTLRPGGFTLTEKGVQYCKLSEKDLVLDLGCGMGATIGYLYEKHQIKAKGIDPSEKLLKIAKEKLVFSEFVLGTGNDLPYDVDSFHCVFAECTLSLMKDLNQTLSEVYRVLKNAGWFVITDVYAKNPTMVKELENYSFNSCIRGLHNLNELKEKLENKGFHIMIIEDCGDLLKELLVKIIFTYGSMDIFWSMATEHGDCNNGVKFQQMLKSCKPGYFMLIAQKREV